MVSIALLFLRERIAWKQLVGVALLLVGSLLIIVHDYRVRIFTPAVEVPMAGHPTVGTAFVLAREYMIQLTEPETTITFEEGVGTVPVTLKAWNGQLHSIQMRQPLPTFGLVFADREAIAHMLSLEPVVLDTTLPLEVVSCGVPFLFVPVKSLEAMRAIRFRLDVWEQLRLFRNWYLCSAVMRIEIEQETSSRRRGFLLVIETAMVCSGGKYFTSRSSH